MNRYGVVQVYSTLWCEGSRSGSRVAVVVFSDCNLWDGHPLHRDAEGTAVCARWCDADFLKGKPTDAAGIRAMLEEAWPKAKDVQRWVHLTGGEPLVQLDRDLIIALRSDGWNIAIETNGTIASPLLDAVDHVTVSPKRGTELKVWRGHDLKVVLPGAAFGEEGWTAEEVLSICDQGSWQNRYVQPQDPLVDPTLIAATALRPGGVENDESLAQGQMLYNAHLSQCLAFINAHPKWRLSPQLHKMLGLP